MTSKFKLGDAVKVAGYNHYGIPVGVKGYVVKVALNANNVFVYGVKFSQNGATVPFVDEELTLVESESLDLRDMVAAQHGYEIIGRDAEPKTTWTFVRIYDEIFSDDLTKIRKVEGDLENYGTVTLTIYAPNQPDQVGVMFEVDTTKPFELR